MTFKELPSSLIEASKDILDESVEKYSALYERYMMLGLKRFGAKRESQLNEIDRRALNAWVQIQVDEACACGMNAEDHMPGDEVFYNTSGEMKKDLEEDSEELDEKVETPADKDEAAKEVAEENKEAETPEAELKEAIAISPDEVATNSAVAVGSSMTAEPKHADVLKDSVPTEGKTEYRLLLQYTINGNADGNSPYRGTQIYPPMSLPGANSISNLKSVVEGMPFYNRVVERALAAASEAEGKE